MNTFKCFRWLIAVSIFYSCQTLWSAPSCRDLFLPFKQIQLAQSRVVQQCSGTCYFEATLAHVENALSLKYGKNLAISRVHLFAELIKVKMASQRFSKWKNQVIQSRKTKTEVELLDLVSAGTQEQIIQLIETKGIVVFDRVFKNLSHVALENRMLEKMDMGVSVHLNTFMKGHLSQKELYRRVMEDLNAVQKIELLRLEKKTSSVHNIKDQKFHTMYESETSYEVNFQSVQKRIVELIKQNQSIFLAYKTHENDALFNSRLSRWENSSVKNEFEGHGVLIVGYKLNREGGIDYLKIRDSQGELKGHRGYFQMPFSFFKERLMFISSIRAAAF